jgi:hypothetical protein
MTMAHIKRSFQVSLHVTHPNIDPAEITEALGMTPVRTTRLGGPRRTPKGDPLSGSYRFSHWFSQLDIPDFQDLGMILETLVERLQSHEPFFRRIVLEGGQVQLFCGVKADGNWDEEFSHAFLKRVADLHVDLRLDVYAFPAP